VKRLRQMTLQTKNQLFTMDHLTKNRLSSSRKGCFEFCASSFTRIEETLNSQNVFCYKQQRRKNSSCTFECLFRFSHGHDLNRRIKFLFLQSLKAYFTLFNDAFVLVDPALTSLPDATSMVQHFLETVVVPFSLTA